MYFRNILIFLGTLILTNKAQAQRFDSVQVYAVSMKSMYRVKINKELIKNEVDPISVKEASTINAFDRVLLDTVKGKFLKKIKSNNLDVRLIVEYYSKGSINKIIGLTSYGTMFVNYTLYEYDKSKLKYLDKYIPGLTNVLGVNSDN